MVEHSFLLIRVLRQALDMLNKIGDADADGEAISALVEPLIEMGTSELMARAVCGLDPGDASLRRTAHRKHAMAILRILAAHVCIATTIPGSDMYMCPHPTLDRA